MHKTTVYLDHSAVRGIRRLARESGRSEAQLIREAIASYLARAARPRLRSLGAGQGPPDLAERADEYLAETMGRAGGRDGDAR